MAFNFLLPLRIVQWVFAILVLALSADGMFLSQYYSLPSYTLTPAFDSRVMVQRLSILCLAFTNELFDLHRRLDCNCRRALPQPRTTLFPSRGT